MQYSASTEGTLLGEPPSMAETMRMRLDFKPSLKKTEVSPAAAHLAARPSSPRHVDLLDVHRGRVNTI